MGQCLQTEKVELLTSFVNKRINQQGGKSANQPTDMSQNQPSNQATNQQGGKSKELKSKTKQLPRATFYLYAKQIKALKLRAVHEERNISELAREAIANYLAAPKH